jgi:hypothetical protein
MRSEKNREAERRVLLIPPTIRDGEVTRSLLAKAGLQCVVCQGPGELAREMEVGVGVVLLTSEVLAAPEMGELLRALAQQPPWSDLAIVLLVKGKLSSAAATRVLGSLTNVTLLERPSPIRSVISAVQAAVRGRERQYQIRDQIESIRSAQAVSNELRQQLEIAIETSELGTFHCTIPLDRIELNDQGKRHFWLPADASCDFDLFYSLVHAEDREFVRDAVEACARHNPRHHRPQADRRSLERGRSSQG